MSVCNACQPPYIYLGVSPAGDGERDVVGRWPRSEFAPSPWVRGKTSKEEKEMFFSFSQVSFGGTGHTVLKFAEVKDMI